MSQRRRHVRSPNSYSKCLSETEISILLAFIFHNSFRYLKCSIVFEFIS